MNGLTGAVVGLLILIGLAILALLINTFTRRDSPDVTDLKDRIDTLEKSHRMMSQWIQHRIDPVVNTLLHRDNKDNLAILDILEMQIESDSWRSDCKTRHWYVESVKQVGQDPHGVGDQLQNGGQAEQS